MSAPIGPGDWVECVEPATGPDVFAPIDGKTPEIGGVYCVLEVTATIRPSDERGVGLKLCGFANLSARGRPGAWPTSRFRPIYRPRGKELINDLLAPVRADRELTTVGGDDQRPARSPEGASDPPHSKVRSP